MSLIERAVGKAHATQPRKAYSPPATLQILADKLPKDPALVVDHFSRRSTDSPEDAVLNTESEYEAKAEFRTEAEFETGAEPLHPASTRVEKIPLEISLQGLIRQGFIAPGADRSHTVEEFRMIKRPLMFNMSGRKDPPLPIARRIMVTSALSGEGKTFCAINLALSLADERDYSVLLVDADVAHPSIPTTLGVEAQPGLMDALDDPTLDVGDLVLTTSIDKLSLLMAGRRHDKATEMLASTAMSKLLQRLSARFPDRIIIFDSPPLLATTEASVLASHMGQIVLIVEAGRTDRGAVAAAIASLSRAPGVVSTLMNKASRRSKSEFLPYGSYGYGYEARA